MKEWKVLPKVVEDSLEITLNGLSVADWNIYMIDSYKAPDGISGRYVVIANRDKQVADDAPQVFIED